jgi:hypothetical protein
MKPRFGGRQTDRASKLPDGWRALKRNSFRWPKPNRFPLAAEHEQFPYELRELHYGVRGRITHRAVFTVAEELVLALSVRHVLKMSCGLRIGASFVPQTVLSVPRRLLTI